MLVQEFIGKWDIHPVPLIPLSVLVTSNKQNGTSFDIECVQNPKFRTPLDPGRNSFIFLCRDVFTVCKRPAELRTTLFKQLEGGNYKLI